MQYLKSDLLPEYPDISMFPVWEQNIKGEWLSPPRLMNFAAAKDSCAQGNRAIFPIAFIPPNPKLNSWLERIMLQSKTISLEELESRLTKVSHFHSHIAPWMQLIYSSIIDIEGAENYFEEGWNAPQCTLYFDTPVNDYNFNRYAVSVHLYLKDIGHIVESLKDNPEIASKVGQQLAQLSEAISSYQQQISDWTSFDAATQIQNAAWLTLQEFEQKIAAYRPLVSGIERAESLLNIPPAIIYCCDCDENILVVNSRITEIYTAIQTIGAAAASLQKIDYMAYILRDLGEFTSAIDTALKQLEQYRPANITNNSITVRQSCQQFIAEIIEDTRYWCYGNNPQEAIGGLYSTYWHLFSPNPPQNHSNL